MHLLSIKPRKETTTRPALTDYGFRLFFLGAALWALVDMLLWTAFYTFHWQILIPFSPPLTWHAHELIYGYGIAVVAGFLLTAVVNWTGRPTLSGYPLALLFLAWLLARLLPLQGSTLAFIVGRCFDLTFLITLAVVTLRPCIQSGKKVNALLVGIHLSLITTGSILFALGALSLLPGGERIGLYLGLYVLVLLTLVMGRRVIPSFIEGASSGTVHLRNNSWLDHLFPPLVVIYIVSELLTSLRHVAPVAALLVTIALAVRMVGWYTHFIWRRPLLWVLYLAYGWFLVGFTLRAASLWFPLNPFLAVHAFTVGGIGTMTLGMMARVGLGHSGRSIASPPRSIGVMFSLITASSLFRVVVPLVAPTAYGLSVAVSQVLWIGAFGLFVAVYAPILTTRETHS